MLHYESKVWLNVWSTHLIVSLPLTAPENTAACPIGLPAEISLTWEEKHCLDTTGIVIYNDNVIVISLS